MTLITRMFDLTHSPAAHFDLALKEQQDRSLNLVSEILNGQPYKSPVMNKQMHKAGDQPTPEKHPVILPPVDPEEVIQPVDDPEYIIPDDEDDTTPPYEAPEPGEGP